ncbi:MAG: RNA polymerase sigma factor [Nitrospinae bacterium]|nr:RNA polymerase sigma factor [Nitrospinota bacterium]
MFSEKDFNQFFRYCIALERDETEAYDLLQDSLEKFLRKGSAAKSPRAYLLRIIRNQFIDRYREANRFEKVKLSENIVSINECDLERLMINKEETELILNSMNGEDREFIYLWAVEGYTISELAKFLKRPLGTCLSKLSRLKIKLKEVLAEEGRKKKRI